MLYIDPPEVGFHPECCHLPVESRWQKRHLALLAAAMVTTLGLRPKQAASQLGLSLTYVYAALKLTPQERGEVSVDARPLVVTPKKSKPLPSSWEVRFDQLVAEVGLDALFNKLQYRRAMQLPTPDFLRADAA